MLNDYNNDFLNELTARGIPITDEQKRRIQEKMTSILNYEPRIGVFGKSGVGKSSLCNSLFGQDICPINDIEACTKKPQEVLLNMNSGKGLKLIDLPGVAESEKMDKKYADLYSRLLPEIDLILWVLKADDRAYSVDEAFYKTIIRPHINKGKPIFFVINQIDKLPPMEEWNSFDNLPGVNQLDNISRKIVSISKYFGIVESIIIPISVKMQWNLSKLVDEVVFSLPREKKITFLKGITEENRSDESKSEVKKAWYQILGELLISVIETGRDIVLHLLDRSGGAIEGFCAKLLHWL